MIPKPCPSIIQHPKNQRLRERKPKRMTLVAGFRCKDGGVLLCADREEDDGYNKREIDKIYRIPVQDLISCDIWLAGSGSGDLIRKFQPQLHTALIEAIAIGKDVYEHHENLIQTELAAFHGQWRNEIKRTGPLNFIVVIAPFRPDRVPSLYRTNKAILAPYPEYCAAGTGQPISDYLADRLFHYDQMDRPLLALLAAFILREAQHSASGVGLGADMKFIHDGGEHTRRELYKEKIKELQDLIPSLGDAIYDHWKDHVIVSNWLTKL
jgi:20S proteasome alpha/beta subunit